MKIWILGSDNRQQYLAEMLKKEGAVIEENEAEYILLPIPDTASYEERVMPLLKKGQKIFGCRFSQNFRNRCKEYQAKCIDYMEIPEVAEKNAIATAEGAIAEALKLGAGNMQESQCLVIGYGRCGSAIVKRAAAWGGYVDVLEIDKKKQKDAVEHGFHAYGEKQQLIWKKYDYVFSTVPELVLMKKELDEMQSDVVIIDIASVPGGVDFAYCREHQMTAKWCKGIPGLYSPKSSAYILMEAIMQSEKGESYAGNK